MYDDLVNQNIIIELENLIKDKKKQKEELDSYVAFMKEVILNTYGVN